MQALFIYTVGMKSMQSVQYTIRGVQPAVDKELRRLARTSGRSLNQVALDALRVGADVPAKLEPDTSLDDLFGTMSADDAAFIEQASKESRMIHPKERH